MKTYIQRTTIIGLLAGVLFISTPLKAFAAASLVQQAEVKQQNIQVRQKERAKKLNAMADKIDDDFKKFQDSLSNLDSRITTQIGQIHGDGKDVSQAEQHLTTARELFHDAATLTQASEAKLRSIQPENIQTQNTDVQSARQEVSDAHKKYLLSLNEYHQSIQALKDANRTRPPLWKKIFGGFLHLKLI